MLGHLSVHKIAPAFVFWKIEDNTFFLRFTDIFLDSVIMSQGTNMLCRFECMLNQAGYFEK